ncbi:L-histidine N(alpha)-methyltransferase [Streptomyces netropsis]|uniref:L-histidine N(alpha)-methyltransferase n=1 Tax=Streptomyces netropsis TaxID=55404 RepID=UPI0037A8928F
MNRCFGGVRRAHDSLYTRHGRLAAHPPCTAIAQYYLDEAEWEVVARRSADIAARTRARTLVDLGAGSGRKTLLLDDLCAEGCLKPYVPVDVSDSAWRDAERALRANYPQLGIQPRRRLHRTAGSRRGGRPRPVPPLR